MCEIIVVTSGKGGVGKTTTTANLGVGLSLLGKKVLMIDTDIGLRNLDVVMGLEHRIFYNLVDVVEGNCRIRQAIIRDRQFTGLYLIPASQTRDKSAVKPAQMLKLLQELREDYDYILLDCPPQMSVLLINALVAADLVVIPIQTDFLALHGLKLLFGTLGTLERGLKRPVHFRALATMYDRRTSACRRVLAMMQAKLGPRLFETVINMDTKFREASAMGKVLTDLAPNSRGAVEYLDFAKEIIRMEGV